MSSRTFFSLVTACLLTMSCGARVRVPAAGAPGSPRLGWVIMVGDRDNPDQEFVCQSDPRTECVMPASRPNSQAFSRTYFYYFPAATDTKYAGTIQIGFLEGTRPHEVTPNTTVKRDGPVANASVFGIVSSMPGPRAMTIDVTAQGGTTQTIRDSVQVILK